MIQRLRKSWARHNRPWDFDHILAKAWIDYRDFQCKEALKQWALGVSLTSVRGRWRIIVPIKKISPVIS